ncbi:MULTISPECIES: glycerol-3-phosphate acyltransferase [unclassified Roseofilum]|uniref:glycerol-3-phosphate acyltransferase n=1 Tax=unclassified Roseofilum TaxID=2620099 RepID=UPI001AFFA25E|nr:MULTISPECIES: glycerol-3-phosphate acyltransferase [unclassified Roseofilum]MBP0008377.1 glycerol-3-phosphate acyltransferase [Roseofilum sp. Belize Diploria]MBP0035431.1 glycerol-3-phosphate acyltransferase [Roseofilum sp. Belize BBD 4]
MSIELLKGLAILIFCPLLGGTPLIQWLTLALTGKNLARLGTGNISVSAAFYHGGKLAGIGAVLSEAGKGIGAVLLARSLFPQTPVWEIIALIALVLGRYFISQAAGTTNATWGLVVHNWQISLLVGLIALVGLTVVRERKSRQYGILILFPLLQILMHPNAKGLAIATISLNTTLALIYQHIPDDLELPSNSSTRNPNMPSLFPGNKGILSLDRPLKAQEVGAKAANLAYLKKLGYPVPPGWILLPGDDPQPVISLLNPSPQNPLIVRSSAFGEDTLHSSGAGQYTSIPQITNAQGLHQAILTCMRSADNPQAIAYRQSRQLPDTQVAVLIQPQIAGVFSGVAFSRDPIARSGEDVIIEVLPGDPSRVVSGQVTPESYRVLVIETDGEPTTQILEGDGGIPLALIHQVAQITRQIEGNYHGIPQDIEWTYDGQQLWLLQTRPITTLSPIWTRKIAAEVIPGFIHPLTWSINQPLTCGVWRDIFAIVLGKKIANLDLNQLATLHHSVAYFNASLLGEIFRKMGLPPESLEFLTRGAKFTRPPLSSTVKQIPGLWRLLQREWSLEETFERDNYKWFSPTLEQLKKQVPQTPSECLDRVDLILETLKRATYYSILSPLSFALRQAVFQVSEQDLDYQEMPEVAALEALQELATCAHHLLPHLETETPETLFGCLSELPDGQSIIDQLCQFMEDYGYLSEVATDISVPRWRDNPRMVRDMFLQQLHQMKGDRPKTLPKGLKIQMVQVRLNLKGQVTQIYSQLLAQLRWSFLALEKFWIESGILPVQGDIFFLTLPEVQAVLSHSTDTFLSTDSIPEIIATRRATFAQDKLVKSIPYVAYGNQPIKRITSSGQSRLKEGQTLSGIGASPGQAEGQVKIMRQLQNVETVDSDTILVVPYTDSGWSLVLAKAGGLISEVGGRLSHGAIVAREYGIPAVMDIPNIMERLHNGQWVRIDGETGMVEVIHES